MVQVNRPMMAEQVQAHLAFFQRKWVQSFLPFGTSLAFHLALIVLGYSVYKVATVIHTRVVEIPAGPVDGLTIAPTPKPEVGDFGPDNDRLKPLTQNIDPTDTDPHSYNMAHGNALKAALNPGGGDDKISADMIGIGARSAIGPGRGTGDEEGGNMSLATYSKFQPGGGKPTASGIPREIPSPKVVFLCDATGSMNSIFGTLRSELQSTINHLKVNQSFGVIFFSDDKVLNLNAAGMLLATDSNKKKAIEFLGDVTPRGMTNPIPAIRAAFAQHPEMMYVLTDGFDQVESLESVYNEFATLNKDGKVKVNTILIGAPDQKELVKLLQRIADDNHGTMKIVSKDNFN